MPPITRKGPRWIEYWPIDELTEHDENPKDHADDDLDESLERFDFTEPVFMCERAQVLAGGHGRKGMLIRARDGGRAVPDGIIERAGVWYAPVVRGWSSKDDAELKAYLVAGNQLSAKGGWLPEPLARILDELRTTVDAGLVGVGFTTADLDVMLADLAPPDFNPEPPDANPRLDVRNPIVCPACGHSFHRV